MLLHTLSRCFQSTQHLLVPMNKRCGKHCGHCLSCSHTVLPIPKLADHSGCCISCRSVLLPVPKPLDCYWELSKLPQWFAACLCATWHSSSSSLLCR